MTTPPPRQVQHPCLPQGLSGSSKLLGCFWKLTCDNNPLPEEQNLKSLCNTALSSSLCFSRSCTCEDMASREWKARLRKHFSQRDVDFSQTHFYWAPALGRALFWALRTHWPCTQTNFIWVLTLPFTSYVILSNWSTSLGLRFFVSTAVRFPWDQTFKVFSLAFINAS